jgi:Arc/MetJ family transcription regulator
MTKNITLAIDDEVLARVRRIAAEKNTTVNALVREYLTHLAGREDRVREAVRQLKEASENSELKVGPITWKRDDLYER